MLPFFESLTLIEIVEQAEALERSLRSIFIDVERRVVAFDPGVASDEEEQHSVDMQGEWLGDELAMAKSVVSSSLGVGMVLLHAHLESGLKRIFKATRGRELNGTRWDQFLTAYREVSIDLTHKPCFEIANAIRNLSNCYKHDSGRPKEAFLLPSGDTVPCGYPVDFSEFDYSCLAKGVVTFLKAVGLDADNPCCPTCTPAFQLKFSLMVAIDLLDASGTFLIGATPSRTSRLIVLFAMERGKRQGSREFFNRMI